MFNVDVLEIKGEKFAILPYGDYEKMMENLEDSLDCEEIKAIKKRIISGEEQLFPADIIEAMFIKDENRVKIFREFRNMSVEELAKAIGKSVEQIRKIERGDSEGSVKTMKDISAVLNVDIGCLV